MCLNNLATEVGGFRYSRGFSPRGCPRFAVTPTTKSLLTQPLYGKGRNPPPSEPPELALGDAFSGLKDYDTGVTPGCCSGWNGLADPFRRGFQFQDLRTTCSDKSPHRGRSGDRRHLHPSHEHDLRFELTNERGVSGLPRSGRAFRGQPDEAAPGMLDAVLQQAKGRCAHVGNAAASSASETDARQGIRLGKLFKSPL